MVILYSFKLKQNSIGAQTRVKLNISQLTLSKLTQSERYKSGSQEVPVTSGCTFNPPKGKLLANLFWSSLCKPIAHFHIDVNVVLL